MLLDEIEARFRDAETAEAVEAVLASDEVQKAMDGARNGAKERLTSIIKAAVSRTAEPKAATDLEAANADWPDMDNLDRDLAPGTAKEPVA